MKNKFSVLLWTGALIWAFAFLSANAATPGSAVLTGKVVDAEDSSPIEYATVSVFALPDSALTTGGITDSQGHFHANKLPYGKYYLRVSFLGYEEFLTREVLVDKKEVSVGEIALKRAAIDMDAVEISEQQNLLDVKIDKKVFNAEQSLVAKGGSGLDLLREVPSVDVDESDVITFRGAANVTILIDGRQLSMPANQYLKMLAASDIVKVEIITNPSARYNTEGSAGILNIITKKVKPKGVHYTFAPTIAKGINWQGRTVLGANYRSSVANVFGSYVYHIYNGSTWSTTKRSVQLESGSWDHLLSVGGDRVQNPSHNVRGGMDLFLNDNNTVYFSGNFNTGISRRHTYVDYFQLAEEGDTLSGSRREGDAEIPLGSASITGGWQHTLAKSGGSLDLNLDYSDSYYEAEEDFIETGGDPLPIGHIQTTWSRDENKILLGRLDLALPLNDSTEVEAGLYLRGRTSDSRFRSYFIDYLDVLPDSGMVDEFDYEEYVMAAYGTFGKQIGKFGFKLGIRGEQSLTTSTVLRTSNVFEKDYFKLYPSLHLSYKFDATNSITLSYGKRINRPTIEMLNPFTYYSDRYLVENGDPYLQPEIIHVTEVGYTKQNRKLTLTASLYNRHILNKNRRYLRQDSTLSTITYKNVARSNFSGLELYAMYQLAKPLRVNFTLNLFNYLIRDDYITEGELVNNVGGNCNLNFFLRLPKGISFQWRNYFTPRYEIQQGYMKARFAMMMAVTKSILDNKGKVYMRASDMLRTKPSLYRSYPQNGYVFQGDWFWESRVVYLGCTFNFGKMVQGKSKRAVKKDNGSDEKNTPGM